MSNYIEYIVKVYDDRTKKWYLNGNLHREDGPAIEWPSGNKEWCLNGKHHREDGPAIVYSTGTKKWYVNGRLHREDGPAVEYADGTKEWWINGAEYTEEEFNKKMNSCDGKEVEIEGRAYILKLKENKNV